MELDLQRHPSVEDATIGELAMDGAWVCWTLEDVVRDGPKVLHDTAIPAGRYQVRITRSARFGKLLPEVLHVPGFTGIRIHGGNTAEDTSGCILVGLEAGERSLMQSQLALAKVLPAIAYAQARYEDVWLTIHPAPPT